MFHAQAQQQCCTAPVLPAQNAACKPVMTDQHWAFTWTWTPPSTTSSTNDDGFVWYAEARCSSNSRMIEAGKQAGCTFPETDQQ
jgi:hypothetical protein